MIVDNKDNIHYYLINESSIKYWLKLIKNKNLPKK